MIILELLLGEKLQAHQDVSNINGIAVDPEWISALMRFERSLHEQKSRLSSPYQNALIDCKALGSDSRVDLDQERWLEHAFVKIVVPLREEYLSCVRAS